MSKNTALLVYGLLAVLSDHYRPGHSLALDSTSRFCSDRPDQCYHSRPDQQNYSSSG